MCPGRPLGKLWPGSRDIDLRGPPQFENGRGPAYRHPKNYGPGCVEDAPLHRRVVLDMGTCGSSDKAF